MTKKLKKAYDIGKQYYNAHKIKLKRNIDMLIDHYDTNLKCF